MSPWSWIGTLSRGNAEPGAREVRLVRAVVHRRASATAARLPIATHRVRKRVAGLDQIVAEFTDIQSGRSDHRPGIEALLAEARRPDRRFDAVITYKAEWFARRMAFALAMKTWSSARGVQAGVGEGVIPSPPSAAAGATRTRVATVTLTPASDPLRDRRLVRWVVLRHRRHSVLRSTWGSRKTGALVEGIER